MIIKYKIFINNNNFVEMILINLKLKKHDIEIKKKHDIEIKKK